MFVSLEAHSFAIRIPGGNKCPIAGVHSRQQFVYDQGVVPNADNDKPAITVRHVVRCYRYRYRYRYRQQFCIELSITTR